MGGTSSSVTAIGRTSSVGGLRVEKAGWKWRLATRIADSKTPLFHRALPVSVTEHAVSDLSPRERDRIVKTTVAPRPIAWISTRSPDGVDNLAPFSAYNYVSSA